MGSPNLRKTIQASVLLVAAGIAWLTLAPRPLGGPVSYVITEGTSMAPHLQSGDLVVVRRASNYQVGDVAAYHSTQLDRVVLHRIVDRDPTGFVFKGDGNDFLDEDRPSEEDILGRQWVRIPGAGKVLGWVGRPLGAGLLTAVVILLLVGGSRSRRRARHTRKAPLGHSQAGRAPVLSTGRVALMAAAVLLTIPSLVLGWMSFSDGRDTDEEPTFHSTGEFTYEAASEARDVYPQGKAETGDPLYVNLVDRVRIRYDFGFASSAPHELSGTSSLQARLSSPSGWKHDLELAPKNTFTTDATSLEGSINLDRLAALIARVQDSTGVRESGYLLTVTPSVELSGHIGNREISEIFEPPLTFSFDGLQAVLLRSVNGDTADGSDVLRPVAEGSLSSTEVAGHSVHLGPLTLSQPLARSLAVIGLLMGLVTGAAVLLLVGTGDDPADIARRYGDRLVTVAPQVFARNGDAIEIERIEDLVKLAELRDQVLLHSEEDGVHSYVVMQEGTTYWYQALSRELLAGLDEGLGDPSLSEGHPTSGAIGR